MGQDLGQQQDNTGQHRHFHPSCPVIYYYIGFLIHLDLFRQIVTIVLNIIFSTTPLFS